MIVNVIIEIPANSTYKYEVEKETGQLVLDRVLGIQVPFNYGYIPHTLAADGDPLDIFVICQNQLFPMSRCRVRLVGVYYCTDADVPDHKLVGILVGEEEVLEPEMDAVKNHIDYYLSNYKLGFEVHSYAGLQEAIDVLMESGIHY